MEPASPSHQFALSIVKRLVDAGYQAVFAGGCVRDQLLGKAPKDYDVATNATPEQVRRLFKHRTTLAVGAQFGVIVIVGGAQVGNVEVATFRRDETYSDGRHPDAVQFSTPAEDAQRRDFTINGLFFDPLQDQVLDYVGGVDDLRAGVIRAIGDPYARFHEDRLRMLRAIRFTVRLGFRLDEGTFAAISRMAPHIDSVSAERITQELRSMFSHPAAHQALRQLAQSGLLAQVWPELGVVEHLPVAAQWAPEALLRPADPLPDTTSSLPTPWEFGLQVISHLDDPQFEVVVAGLLGTTLRIEPVQAIRQAEELGRRWRLSRDEAQAIGWFASNAHLVLRADQIPWSTLQPVLVDRRAPRLIDLAQAVLRARGESLGAVQHCRDRLQWPAVQLNPSPLVSGDDLIRLQISPGPAFRFLLEEIRRLQLDGQIQTTEQACAMIPSLYEAYEQKYGHVPR